MTDGVIVEKIPVNRFFFKSVKFWFGMYVWQSITEKREVVYEDLGSVDDDEFIIDCLYFAQEYGAIKDKKRTLKRDTIKNSYELMPQKQLQRIVDCMLNSRFGGDSIALLQCRRL